VTSVVLGGEKGRAEITGTESEKGLSPRMRGRGTKRALAQGGGSPRTFIGKGENDEKKKEKISIYSSKREKGRGVGNQAVPPVSGVSYLAQGKNSIPKEIERKEGGRRQRIKKRGGRRKGSFQGEQPVVILWGVA